MAHSPFIIVAIDGKKIANAAKLTQFLEDNCKVGQEVTVKVWREDMETDLRLTLTGTTR